MVVVGIGLGLFTGQLVDLTMSAVSESFSDVSSGVINSLSQLGYAFGTAVAGSVQLSRFYGSVVDGVTLLTSGTFGTAVAGSVQLSRFYGSVVDGVTLLTSGTTLSAADRRQLAVRVEDAVETTTEAQQQAFLNGLPPEVQQQLLGVIRAAMVAAQQSVLVVLVLFVLVTLLAAGFLPAGSPRRESQPTPTTQADSDGSDSGD